MAAASIRRTSRKSAELLGLRTARMNWLRRIMM
jgi:hypothetical protein